MADFGCDQAAGLRRLLARASVRMMALEAGTPGVGKTSVLINVAAALAARGSRVLVIDENSGPGSVAGLLGVRPRVGLEQVMRGARAVEDALAAGPRGITVLGAAGGARALSGMQRGERERLIAGFNCLDGRYDMVLVDTPRAQAAAASLFTHAVPDTIVVSTPAANAITAAYALIKRLRAGAGARRFHLLLNRVGSARNARVVVDNLQSAARAYLATPLECVGCVPLDRAAHRAAGAFVPVVDADPNAPAAVAYRRIAASIASWPRERAQPRTLDSLLARLMNPPRLNLAHAGA